MAQTYVAAAFEEATGVRSPNLESSRSGVSWGAIFAGGATAAAVSLVLLLLGAGLGLASLSPYAGDSVSATGLAVGAVIWLIVVQWIASALGGYMAGRLRAKWADPSSDEVFFRDTAHGLLAWAAGTLLMVAVAAAGGLSALAVATTGASVVASQVDDSYFVDQLFRPVPGIPRTSEPGDEGALAEGARILDRAVAGMGSDADRAYLAEVIVARTGLSAAEAEQRVNQVTAAAREAADEARKAGALASLATALSLLVGAFIGAVAGALGGKYRDELPSA
jgi:hypothetical protein